MAEPFTLCEHEIAHVCGYIKDDGTVANYFGVPRGQVKSVRSKMRKDCRRNASHFLDKDVPAIGLAMGDWRNDGIPASERLKDALDKLFRRFEIEHGLQAGAGQILLPAGWSGK